MRRYAALATIFAAAIALGGCSVFSSDDDEKVAETESATAEVIYAPVEAVRQIEIGRTRNGYVISAKGIAPGLGYGAPELRARREGQAGPDGFIDYDFVAQAPDPGFDLGVGAVEARGIRADLQVTSRDLQGAAGVRVHGVRGGVQMRF